MNAPASAAASASAPAGLSASVATHAPLPPPGRALPAWVYQHPQMTRLEYERIVRPSWQILCHVNSIPRPGDYTTMSMGPDTLAAVRAADGTIRVFHNVCRHRGARLLDGTGHCSQAIVCPYHGWSYRLNGELLATPVRESFPTLDRTQYGLKAVKSAVMLGFVFACIEGDPPPLEDTWRRIAEELAPYRIEEMVPCGEPFLEVWEADWKIAMDNYLESYHVPIGHPGLNRMFTPDYDDQWHTPGVGRGVSWMRPQPSARLSERVYQSVVGQVSEALPEPNRRCWRFYSILPNLGIDVFPEQMDFFQVLPLAPGRCMIRSAQFAHPDSRREAQLARRLGARLNAQVNREDRELCARVQQGLASPSYEPGPLSGLECFMLEFHELLRARIPEVRLPRAPAQFA